MTLKDVIEELKEKVSLERFNPVEKIVYGFTTLILTAVVVAILAVVIKSK